MSQRIGNNDKGQWSFFSPKIDLDFSSFISTFKKIEPLSNIDIADRCKKLKIKNFKGVFMRDELNKSSKKECLVLNLDHSRNNGTHWTCLFIQNNTCYYFDSYGFKPPLEVEKYCRNIKDFYYSTFRIQNKGQPLAEQQSCLISKLNEVGCGHFCIYVLHKLDIGCKFYDILSHLYQFS